MLSKGFVRNLGGPVPSSDKGVLITKEMIAMLSTWRHSGFHAFCGNSIQPKEEKAMENMARYIIRASFSQEQMQYLADEGTVWLGGVTHSRARSAPRKSCGGGYG